MQAIYFVGGIAGVGKSSHLVEKFSQKGNFYVFETDGLRPRYNIKLPNLTVDDFAWNSVRHLIKYRSSLLSAEGIVFLGVACEPKNLRQLEHDEPGITIRTALVGASKQFHRFEKYPKPEPSEAEKSEGLKKEELELTNCEYFDLIEYASAEEQIEDLVKLREKEVDVLADKIIKHLLDH